MSTPEWGTPEWHKLHPIFGTDFSKPLSEIIEDIRKQLSRLRGQLDDVGHVGWKEWTDTAQGNITCTIVYLSYLAKEMKQVEDERAKKE